MLIGQQLAYLVWSTNQTILSTSLLDDVTNQMLLAIVSGQYRDLVSWIADHPHVHEHGHHVLSFCQVLRHKQFRINSKLVLQHC